MDQITNDRFKSQVLIYSFETSPVALGTMAQLTFKIAAFRKYCFSLLSRSSHIDSDVLLKLRRF